ncbi:hypothetical protein GY45DRAFT_556209 [Cubamyces sp. BRFM 1775]|nr:hypothetical protein GY45DRAFT_556209 [Cubamyces sp. BRFM 1775]
MVNANVWLMATAHNSPGSFSCALLTTAFPSTAPSPQTCLARPSVERQERVVSRIAPGRVPPCRSVSSTWQVDGHLRVSMSICALLFDFAVSFSLSSGVVACSWNHHAALIERPPGPRCTQEPTSARHAIHRWCPSHPPPYVYGPQRSADRASRGYS